MDSAFEKLGVYEFFTVFLSGVITETHFGIILHCCFHISFSLDQYILPFLLLGYFIGLLLHELSVLLRKIIKKPFCTIFTDNNVFVNDEDRAMAQRVKTFVLKKENGDTKSDEYVASVCCNELQVKKQFTNADGLRKESEFALSLSIAFGLLVILIALTMGYFCIMEFEYEVLFSHLSVGLSAVLAVLFFDRSKRMHKFYMRCLIRTYAVIHELTAC